MTSIGLEGKGVTDAPYTRNRARSMLFNRPFEGGSQQPSTIRARRIRGHHLLSSCTYCMRQRLNAEPTSCTSYLQAKIVRLMMGGCGSR